MTESTDTFEKDEFEPNVLAEDFARCCDPLDGDEPLGLDVMYEDVFEDLKAEVENIASGSADWKQIKTLSIEILSTKSKDLNTVGFLIAALMKLHGYQGLVDGLAILRYFVEAEWEGVFPKMARARAFALVWLVSRVSPYVEACEAPEKDGELVKQALAHVQAIDAKARDLKELAPSFGDLRSALNAKVPEEPEEPDNSSESESESEEDNNKGSEDTTPKNGSEASPTPLAETPAETATRSESKVRTPEIGSDATSSQIRDAVRGLIGPLRHSNSLASTSYRLLRVLKWDELTAPPPADPGSGKTRVPAPRAQLRGTLSSLHQGGKWPQLLEATEAAFQDGSGTFWLDLQYYTVAALENLDGGTRVAEAVKDEVARILRRFADLQNLSFSDGTPFASQPTKQWLEESVNQEKMDVVQPVGGRTADAALTSEEIELATSHFDKKDPTAALDVLQSAIERATSQRGTFLTKLTVAQICLHSNRVAWARIILEELSQEMAALHLEQWEPEVAVEVYHLLALCYGRMLRTAENNEERALQEALSEVETCLFRLDLRAVAKIDQAIGDKAKSSRGWKLFQRSS